MDTTQRLRQSRSLRPYPASLRTNQASEPDHVAIMANQADHSLDLQLELGDPFPASILDLALHVGSSAGPSQSHNVDPLYQEDSESLFSASEDEDGEVEMDPMDTALPDGSEMRWTMYDAATDTWTEALPSETRDVSEGGDAVVGNTGNWQSDLETRISSHSLSLPFSQTRHAASSIPTPSSESAVPYQLDLSPRGLRSFKRSFDQATSLTPPPDPSAETTSALDLPTFSVPRFFSSNSSETQSARANGTPWAARSSSSALTPEQTAATNSAHRYSPPTPSSLARVKRRRSGRAGQATSAQLVGQSRHAEPLGFAQLPLPLASVEGRSSPPHVALLSSDLGRESAGHPSTPLTNWRFPSFSPNGEERNTAEEAEEAKEESTNLNRYITQLLADEEGSQSANGSRMREHLAGQPSNSDISTGDDDRTHSIPTVSTRRGNDTFSLGNLPRFDFLAEDDDDLLSPMSLYPHFPRLPTPRSYRALPGESRRPNLHRNATAVSPPEESPLNTPDVPLPQQQAGSLDSRSSFFTARARRIAGEEEAWNPAREQQRADSLLADLERTRSILAEVDSFRPDQSNASHGLSMPPVPGAIALERSSVDSRLSIPRLEPFSWQRENPLPSEQPASTNLWGDLTTPGSAEGGSHRVRQHSAAATSRIPTLQRRPGSLGRGGMRGPTRSSNEAWLRSQGIDFYDALGSGDLLPAEPFNAPSQSARRRTATAPEPSLDAPSRTEHAAHSRTLRRVAVRPFGEANAQRAEITPVHRNQLDLVGSSFPLSDQTQAAQASAASVPPYARLSRRRSELWNRLESLQQQISTPSSSVETSLTDMSNPPSEPSPPSVYAHTPGEARQSRLFASRPSRHAASHNSSSQLGRSSDRRNQTIQASNEVSPVSGILAVREQLDSVRQVLDGLERNRRELRGASPARLPTQQAHRLFRPSTSVASRTSALPAQLTSPSTEALPAERITLPLFRHHPPIGRPSRATGDNFQEDSTIPRRVLQPFEEIYAEVEAEFAGRPIQPVSGGSRPWSNTRGMMQELIEELDSRGPSASSTYSPAGAGPLADSAALRRRSLRDRRPFPEFYGLEDWSTDFLEDFGEGGQTTDSDQVPLPPFLLRSLRARRQASFGQLPQGTGIASEAGNYLDDIELDMSYEGLLALSERIGQVKPRGASDMALAAGLTKYKYSCATSSTSVMAVGESRCGICLEDYAENDCCSKSRMCGHAMHSECFEAWLKQNDTCPICRQTAV